MAYLRVTAAELATVQALLVELQATALEVTYGRLGYVGMAGRDPETGELRPPGKGETTAFSRPRELLDGNWAIPVDETLTYVDELNGRSFSVSSVLGTRVRGVRIPAAEDIDDADFVVIPQDTDDVP